MQCSPKTKTSSKSAHSICSWTQAMELCAASIFYSWHRSAVISSKLDLARQRKLKGHKGRFPNPASINERVLALNLKRDFFAQRNDTQQQTQENQTSKPTWCIVVSICGGPANLSSFEWRLWIWWILGLAFLLSLIASWLRNITCEHGFILQKWEFLIWLPKDPAKVSRNEQGQNV